MMKFDMELTGRRIRSGIKAKGMTAGDFAREIGVSPNTLANWTCGRVGISLAGAVKIADALGWSLDWLAVRDTPAESPELVETS